MAALDSAIEKLERFPRSSILALSILANVYLLTKLLAVHEKDAEKAAKNLETITYAFSKADTASTIAIKTLQEKSILKDTLLSMKSREYQQLQENLKSR